MEQTDLAVPTKDFFRRLNVYFDKIYVLTVASSTERQKEFAKVMDGLDYHFFYGTDRRTLEIDALEQQGIYNQALSKKAQRYGKSMTTSEIACSLGHCHMYEDMIANNIQRALIFEDDVFPLFQHMQLLGAMLETVPADWGIFYFDYNKNEKVVPFKRAKKLLELQKPVTMTSDNLLANAITKEHLNGYIAIPKLFAQKSVGDSASIESMIERFVKIKPE